MSQQFEYASIPGQFRKAIHLVRVTGEHLDPPQLLELTEEIQEFLLAKYGEQNPDIVIMQGSTKEDLRFSGASHCVNCARTALFNAAVSWRPLDLD